MKWLVWCSACREHLDVEVPIGASIWRTKDRVLAEHIKREHS